jgi:hypothetical protein
MPTASLSNLAELAREAYGQKRTKDCLDLTRAILLIDPDNAEAQLMRSEIRAEMHQNLENAQALLRSAQVKDNSDNDSQTDTKAVLTEDTPAFADAVPLPLPTHELSESPVSEEVFAAPIRNGKVKWLKRASIFLFLGVAAVGFSSLKSKSNSVQSPLQASGGSTPNSSEAPTTPAALPAAAPSPADELVDIRQLAPKVDRPVPQPEQELRERPPLLTANGTLAVSSTTSVDIYMDDLYVGSAPVSLEISAGTHTVEYRHGNLRKRVTHVINSNETTRATITFDVALQINAKPWADVFLDGTDRKPLGQTPLSGIRAPIGGVLVFENPGFATKRYRITGNETGIQIVFP